MLKYRLIFGTLMTIFFIGLVLFDGRLDGSLNSQNPAAVQATLLAILLIIVAVPANLELSRLLSSGGAKIFWPVTVLSSILLSTVWYWSQFFSDKNQFAALFFILVVCISALAIFLWQGFKYASVGAFANCGANLLSIIYLGALASFFIKIRIDFGPLIFLWFVFVVKFCDIGAYTSGRLFGKHKFSPVISPKKTWEGMAGGVIFAVIAASIFALVFDIMPLWQAVVFGIIFAFIGQLGDLAESMLKRAAEQKDASTVVPGFGGILDVIDSPLASAVFAYIFFRIIF
ncbi:MAG: phosphatidate cytidylyltransferase [Sedimentisphaerales bacterium]|jgi:phosphatidate cytidylyltransferase